MNGSSHYEGPYLPTGDSLPSNQPSANDGQTPASTSSGLNGSQQVFMPSPIHAPSSSFLATSPPRRSFLTPSPPPPTDGSYSHSPYGGDGGRTAAAGKSGRVIERLMAENDRLRREVKVQTTAREEERRAKEAIQQARDSLQSTNDNLILQNNIDKSSLARKDRKIEELKAERDFERERRVEMDSSLKIHVKQADNQVQELKLAFSQEQMEKKKAVNQYEVLQQSWKHLDEGYRTRLEKLRTEIKAISAERKRDYGLLQRLEITLEQQRQELEKLRASKNQIVGRCEAVIEEAEQAIRDIRGAAQSTQQELEQKVKEAGEIVGTMKHVIAVKQNLRD